MPGRLYVFALMNRLPDVGFAGATPQNDVLAVLYLFVAAKRVAIDASKAVLYASEPSGPAARPALRARKRYSDMSA